MAQHKFPNMHLTRFSSQTLVVITLLITLAGCQSNRTPDTNSASPSPPQTSSDNAKQTTAAKPSLSGTIDNLSIYPVPNNHENLAISLVVSISNSGASINAEDWTLAVNTPGHRDLRGLQPVHVNGVVAMPGTGQRVDLDKEDLAIKSKDTAIAKDSTLKGILTFVLPKLSAADLSNNDSTLVIHFKDRHGNSYQTGKALIGAQR
jgi:hypothetical protein